MTLYGKLLKITRLRNFYLLDYQNLSDACIVNSSGKLYFLTGPKREQMKINEEMRKSKYIAPGKQYIEIGKDAPIQW